MWLILLHSWLSGKASDGVTSCMETVAARGLQTLTTEEGSEDTGMDDVPAVLKLGRR